MEHGLPTAHALESFELTRHARGPSARSIVDRVLANGNFSSCDKRHLCSLLSKLTLHQMALAELMYPKAFHILGMSHAFCPQ